MSSGYFVSTMVMHLIMAQNIWVRFPDENSSTDAIQHFFFFFLSMGTNIHFFQFFEVSLHQCGWDDYFFAGYVYVNTPTLAVFVLAMSSGYFVNTMVVYLTLNQKVPGSSPGRNFFHWRNPALFLLFLLNRVWSVLIFSYMAELAVGMVKTIFFCFHIQIPWNAVALCWLCLTQW